MTAFHRVKLPRLVFRVDPPEDDDDQPLIYVRGSYVVDATEVTREIGIPAADRQPYRVIADVITNLGSLGELVTQAFAAYGRPAEPSLPDREAALRAKAHDARQRVTARFAVCTCAYPYVRARTTSGHPVTCPAHEVHLRDRGGPVLPVLSS